MRYLGLSSIAMSITGFISLVNSMSHQHRPGALAGALAVLTMLSVFCAYVAVKMARIMERLEKEADT